MTEPRLPERFPATRYRVTAIVERSFRMGDYGGHLLRGALGHQLRQQVCITALPDCRGCSLQARCAFPALWLPMAPERHDAQRFSEIPVAYVIEPPPMEHPAYQAGDALTFHLVLIGSARGQIDLLRAALGQALKSLGADRGSARLLDCEPEIDSATGLPPPPPCPEAIRLDWLTPLRMQQDGKSLKPDALRTDRLLMGLVKRAALLSEFHAGQPLGLAFRDLAQRATEVRGQATLTPRRLRRFSSRQQKALWLDGALGHWVLSGNLAPFWPFLWWGQWLHVGKNTSFGLGAYRLSPM